MTHVFLNGQIINRENAQVDIEDRGYQFGDGIYEVIRVYDSAMFTATEHLARLRESAEKLQLELPFTEEELLETCRELIKLNNLQTGIIYIQVTRGVSPRTHAFPAAKQKAAAVIYTTKLERPLAEMARGVKVITTEDIRWLRCDIKSLNLLGNILAKEQANQAGGFEAIQHRDGIVTEGSSSNVSILVDGTLFTHPANNFILNGITRQVMLKLCEKAGLTYEETTFTREQLLAADEVFLTGTTTEIMPIIQVDGQKIGRGTPGMWTKKLQQLFEQEIKEQCR